MKNKRQKTNKKQQVAIVESIDTKIAKAVYAEKKISERIIGYFPYELQFVKATYFGTTQRPAKISAIEKGKTNPRLSTIIEMAAKNGYKVELKFTK